MGGFKLLVNMFNVLQFIYCVVKIVQCYSHNKKSHSTHTTQTSYLLCPITRGERRSAASNGVQAVNKLLSVYGDDKELTPAVQELCATIDAYIFVVDSGKALTDGKNNHTELSAFVYPVNHASLLVPSYFTI